MKKLVAMLALTSVITLSGCSTRIADLTVASSKNMNLNSANLVIGERVENSDSVPIIIFPLGSPDMKEAIDNTIEMNKCAVGLSNVVIEQSFFSFIFGFISYDVEGNLIIDRNKPGCKDYTIGSDVIAKKKSSHGQFSHQG